MIIKSFELNKINSEKTNFYLFYGENEGHKNETIENLFNTNSNKNIYRYDEKEILDDTNNFFNSILSKSFFENKKIVIISRAGDKIFNIIEEIIEKDVKDIKIIINAEILDKKSKLRNFFEKDKSTICIPFYSDNLQTLNTLVNKFFNEKKIPISQQLINLLVERSRGDRQNLKNELNKIEAYIKNKNKINLEEILKLTNLAENYNISELIDSCLSKNYRKTINILNENNFSLDDSVLITRTLLIKTKRLYKLLSQINNDKNVESIISSFKPPIFWKDKEIVKQQIKNWDLKNTEKLIYKTNEMELLIKKNATNSINILTDFIISIAFKTNSGT